MNPTMPEITFVVVMAALNVALFVWVHRGQAAATAGRMMRMMGRVGLDPAAVPGDAPACALIGAARRSCRHCRVEAMCDRWCAGEVEGDNAFCPNARLFRALAGGPRLVA